MDMSVEISQREYGGRGDLPALEGLGQMLLADCGRRA